MTTTKSRLALSIIYGCLSCAGYARADAVVDWNAIAIQSITTAVPGRPGPSAFLDIAMVQAAVYDAVEAIDGRFRPYHLALPIVCGSTTAAAAKAAHDVLVNRFPGEAASLDTAYHQYFSEKKLSESDPGVAVGQQAAAGIIALRINDGSFPNPPPPPFTGGTERGVWRPTISYQPGGPPSFAPMETPWFAEVVPFTLTSPSQFRAEPPPPFTSGRYARAYNEIKAQGAFFSNTRTADQTDLAFFWATNYLVVWNQTLRDISSANIPDVGESARLFALANMAMADAGITAWNTKRHYVSWRPITAIQEGDHDGNRRTAGDPDWQPLMNTPNYPDYISGANAVTGAVTHILTLFFGTDEMSFSVTTTNPIAVRQTRNYSHFSDAAEEVVNARIFEGIHFRFADTAGRRQGRRVARWAFTHFLRPVGCRDVDADDRQDGEN